MVSELVSAAPPSTANSAHPAQQLRGVSAVDDVVELYQCSIDLFMAIAVEHQIVDTIPADNGDVARSGCGVAGRQRHRIAVVTLRREMEQAGPTLICARSAAGVDGDDSRRNGKSACLSWHSVACCT